MKIIIAIVGMTGSGKSTEADCLIERGWSHIRFGQVTIEHLKKESKEINPENEKAMREKLRHKHGMGAFAILSLSVIKESLKQENVVIDGLYSWTEYKILQETFGNRLHVVAIFSSPQSRYERLERRLHDAAQDPNYRMRPLTTEQARVRDHTEIENIEKGGPIAMADLTIINNSTPADMSDELLAYVDDIISE